MNFSYPLKYIIINNRLCSRFSIISLVIFAKSKFKDLTEVRENFSSPY